MTIEELLAEVGASPLLKEWSEMPSRDPAVRFTTRVAGDTVFVVSCESGYHESRVSWLDALEQMVDAHRTRVEDLGSTRDLIWWADHDAHAGEIAHSLASVLRAANPGLAGAERDHLVLAKIADAHAEQAHVRGVTLAPHDVVTIRDDNKAMWATDRKRLFPTPHQDKSL